jgi:hypothetical protein
MQIEISITIFNLKLHQAEQCREERSDCKILVKWFVPQWFICGNCGPQCGGEQVGPGGKWLGYKWINPVLT